MNAVLDVLKLRKVRLNYMSPAICPVTISGSGSSVFVETNEGPATPTGLVLKGQCNAFLVCPVVGNIHCMSLYKALDAGDPASPYTLVTECAPPYTVTVCSPGWWYITVADQNGNILAQTSPVVVTSVGAVNIPIPVVASGSIVTVYKNADYQNPGGSFFPVMSHPSMIMIAFEVCDDTACYKLQAITENGASGLSAPACRIPIPGCCPAQPCSVGEVWNDHLCSCVEACDFVFSALTNPLGCLNNEFSSVFTVASIFPALTLSIESGTLPTGTSFQQISGDTGIITGLLLTSGSYTFTVKATGGSCIERHTYTVSVLGILSPSAIPGGQSGTAYTYQILSGGGIPPINYVLDGGTLPAGLTLNPNGSITGTPTQTGTFYFIVRAAGGTPPP